ncbi:hypothetical protein FACS189498_3750 [Spirochaetia bacterium]|nr:hypothetical protein FACS189498_3750 [Spirochaetia bacterium]
MKEDEEQELILRGNLAVSYEHRFRTGLVLVDEDDVIKNALDFNRAYLSMNPFLSLGAGIGGFQGLLVDALMEFRPPYIGEDGYAPDHNFMPLPTVDINFNFLSRGTVGWNGKHLDIFFGRDNFHLGNTPAGTLYPAGTLPYQDGLRLFAPLGPFSFDYLLATIVPRKAPHDVDPNDGVTDGNEYFGFMQDDHPSIILMALHRFQWNFGPIKAGIGGTVVYARSNNMFLMTDILPISVYHNADIRPNNLSMIVDFSWTIFRGFTFSAMAGFDDISAKTFGLPDGPTPTIPAFILQAEYSFSTEDLFMEFLLEGGYTHYLWGNFAYGDDVAWGNVPLARAIYRYAPNNDAVLLPLTSPYGPGAVWGRLVTVLDIPRLRANIKADLLLLSKTRAVNLVDTPYTGDSSLEFGPQAFYASLDLPCSYTLGNFEFSLSPALIFADSKTAFECTLGVSFKLDGRKAITP